MTGWSVPSVTLRRDSVPHRAVQGVSLAELSVTLVIFSKVSVPAQNLAVKIY